MVATTTIATRVERSLHAVLGELEALAHTAEQWPSWSEIERVDFSLEWDHLMADYLTELDEFYRGHEMTAEQRLRYREVLRRLRDVRPLIERLDLYPPPVSLDA